MLNCLSILNEALAGKQFLAGDYTLADTHLNSLTDWLRQMNVDFSAYPALSAWSQRCSARPAYARAAAQNLTRGEGLGEQRCLLPAPHPRTAERCGTAASSRC